MISLKTKQNSNHGKMSQAGTSQALTDFLFIMLVCMACAMSVLAKKQMVDHAVLVEELPDSTTEVSQQQLDEIPLFEMDEHSDAVCFDGHQFDSFARFAEYISEHGIDGQHTKVRFKIKRTEPTGDFLDAEQLFLNQGISVVLRKGTKNEQ